MYDRSWDTDTTTMAQHTPACDDQDDVMGFSLSAAPARNTLAHDFAHYLLREDAVPPRLRAFGEVLLAELQQGRSLG